MTERPRIEIRSYRAVFDLERRLYRVDGLRLNPSGVPVRGIVALAALLATVLAAQRLPFAGTPSPRCRGSCATSRCRAGPRPC